MNGGPAEELCDVPGLLFARGAWGRDGVIVFAPSNKYERGPLRSVPTAGGESSPLTTVEPGESHRFPVFLPDGRHFLYTSVGGPSPGIYLASLDDVEGRRLLADASSAHFAPAAGSVARLLFIRDGNLMAQPFDTDQLGLTGEPFLLLEGAPYADDGAAAISVSDDGTLSYGGGRNRATDSRFAWFDRSGNVLSHEGPVGPPASAALSPSEETMAVSRRPPGQWNTDLWLRELTRDGIETRLTFQNVVDVASNAVWSPDSRRIAFSANPTGTYDLFWKETSSSDPAVLLLETENPKYVSDWSRDGRYVLYTELDPETGADLWYLPLEKEGAASEVLAAEPVAFLQTKFLESAGQLSPDGNWIAYVSVESGEDDIYVRHFPSGLGMRKISNGAARQPRWSADGRELFYLTGPASRQTLMRAAVTTPSPASSGGPSVFATTAPEPLFQVRANGFHPATGTFFYSVSADGQRFLVNHVETTEEPVLNVVTNWQLAFAVPQGR